MKASTNKNVTEKYQMVGITYMNHAYGQTTYRTILIVFNVNIQIIVKLKAH